jgi:hypothetical protein
LDNFGGCYWCPYCSLDFEQDYGHYFQFNLANSSHADSGWWGFLAFLQDKEIHE